jgi:hypothetical protein
VEQVRNSFSGENRSRQNTYDYENEQELHRSGGFLKVRFFLALLLFLAFFFVKQTDFSYQNVGASEIEQEIRSTVELPEDFSDILYFIN